MSKLNKKYEDYRKSLKSAVLIAKFERVDDDERSSTQNALAEQFRRDCEDICPSSEMLCDILLKMCYKTECSKRFVWEMCGEQIVKNLFAKSGKYTYFTRDSDGETAYRGQKYKKNTVFNDNKE